MGWNGNCGRMGRWSERKETYPGAIVAHHNIARRGHGSRPRAAIDCNPRRRFSRDLRPRSRISPPILPFCRPPYHTRRAFFPPPTYRRRTLYPDTAGIFHPASLFIALGFCQTKTTTAFCLVDKIGGLDRINVLYTAATFQFQLT